MQNEFVPTGQPGARKFVGRRTFLVLQLVTDKTPEVISLGRSRPILGK